MKPKQLLFLVFIYSSHFVFSQSPDFEGQRLIALSQIDTSLMPTNIFYDKVPEYYKYKIQTGLIQDDSLIIDILNWKFSYGMIANSHISGNVLDSFVVINNLLDTLIKSDTINFGGLYYRYHRFRDDALALNLISWDSTYIHDVPLRPFSPYLVDTTFMFSAFKQDYEGLHVKMIFDSDWIFSNIGFNSALQINFEDGNGWQTLTFDQLYNITYSTYGNKIIKIRYISSGVTRECWTYVEIKEVSSAFGNLEIRGFELDPTWIHKLLNGITIYKYQNTNCGDDLIRKPLIIIEGFDPSNKNGPELVINSEESGLLQILQEGVGILSDIIHDNNFDIFYLNFWDSGLSIETNAGFVQAAIERINYDKNANGSFEKNIVIGASMGGLVGKWALRTMEINNIDHQTEKFISIDSPFRGANVPIGAQALIYDLSFIKVLGIPLYQLKPSLAEGLRTLDCAAARDMLLYHGNTDGNNVNRDLENLSQWHTIFQENFDNLGDLNIPHYAIANGSLNNDKQNFNAGEKLCDFDFAEVLTLVGITIYADIFAMGNGSHEVYSRDAFQFIGPLILPTFGALTVTDGNSIDNAPGGTRPFMTLGPSIQFNWTKPVFCFVPTFSALNIETSDPFQDFSDLGNFIPSETSVKLYQGQTESHNYTVPINEFQNVSYTDVNSPHVTFDASSASFLLNTITKLEGPSNPLENRTYNYGIAESFGGSSITLAQTETRNIIDYDLTIGALGKLWVNRDDKIGYTDLSNPENLHTQTFDLNIRPHRCENSPTLVTIGELGKMELGDGAVNNVGNLNIWDNATLEIGVRGEVLADRGTITIKNGGVLRVNSGGLLRLSNDTKLVIKDGGELIIDEGAIIQLWDGNTLDGRAKIHTLSGGKLTWKGDINFTGNGFFEFDQGHEFNLESDFNLTGFDKECRLIQVNGYATLSIDTYNVHLTDAKIVVNNVNGGSLTDGLKFISNETIIENSTFINGAQSSTGLNLVSPISYQIENVDFMELLYGFKADSYTGDLNSSYLKDCNFIDCANGIQYSNSTSLYINNCTIDAENYSATYGVNLIYTPIVFMEECNIENIDGTGIRLFNVPFFRMHGGNINSSNIGINVPESLIDENKSNIFLFNQATIQQCSTGIKIEKGSISSTSGLSYGMVHMSCSNLWQNSLGIEGEDILLSIDGTIGKFQNGGLTAFANSFSNGLTSGNLIFKICYTVSIPEVLARNNLWQSSPAINTDYWLKDANNSACSLANSSDIPLISSPQASGSVSAECPEHSKTDGFISTAGTYPGLVPDGVFETDDKCTYTASGTTYHQGFAFGFRKFFNEDYDNARLYFDSIVSTAAPRFDIMSTRCQEYVRIARVMSDALGSSISSYQYSIPDYSSKSNGELQVYPNPAKDEITVKLPTGNYIIEIFDFTGKSVITEQIGNSQNISLTNMPTGFYFIRAVENTSKQIYQTKFVISN